MVRPSLAVLLGLAAAALPAALAASACSSSPSADTITTGWTALPNPLVLLERGTETAALARLAGGTLTETPPDPVLGTDQFLLDAVDAQGNTLIFVGVDDDGSLRAIDPVTLQITATYSVYQDHPAATSTPHGIYGVAVDPLTGDLWVSRDDVNEVAVIAPDGGFSHVDLSDLDPVEHHPDMNGILLQGGRVYVALGFLTHADAGAEAILSDLARRPGMIAIIDVATRTIVGQIDLVGHNPVRKLIPVDDAGQRFIVATPGQHDYINAGDGIDSVDLDAGTATQLISETALDGSVDEVVWAGPTEAYANVLGAVPQINPTSVVAFDPQTGVVRPPLAQAPWFTDQANGAAYVHVGLAIDGDVVACGDHDPANPSILLFSRATGQALPPVLPAVEAPWALFPVVTSGSK